MIRCYEVNVRGREWSHFIEAETAGKAKYEYLLDVRDAWPDTTFADLECHVASRRPPTRKELAQQEADAFNAAHPVGTMLRFWSGVKEGAPTGLAAISHPAQVMSDHASVWMSGVRSCHSLSHVEAVDTPPGGAA